MSGIAGDVFDIDAEASEKAPAVITLRVRVRAGAGMTKIAGRDGTALAVQCATPHSSMRSNTECADLVAETLGVEGSSVELSGGEKLREKRFRVTGVDIDDARRRLDIAIGEAMGTGRRRGR